MPDPACEPLFRLDIAGQGRGFEVLAFTGTEAISTPFVFDLQVQVGDLAPDAGRLMYRDAYLHMDGRCGIHGQIHGVVQADPLARPAVCRLRLGPKLACLGQRFNQRVFSDLGVPQILMQVLREHGIHQEGWRFDLVGDYPVRDYCTQYSETDLQFLQRLCAQENIHYHFEHHRAGHCLVFADTHQAFARQPPRLLGTERFHLQLREPLGLGSPGPVEGHSDLVDLRSGVILPLAGHSRSAWNRLWLLTGVQHQGGRWGAPDTADSGGYRNHFRAHPLDMPYMPAHPPAEPLTGIVQRAWVVEPLGDQSVHAAQGRVALRFEWLYSGRGAATDYCWVAVSPLLTEEAIKGLLPGVEVLVSFAEGNPDRPLIIGYLAGQQVPAADAGQWMIPPQESDRAVIEATLDRTQFMEAGRGIEVTGDLELVIKGDGELQFNVGQSQVKTQGDGLDLCGAQVVLDARPAQSGHSDEGEGQQGLLELLQGGHPLVMLCMLPAGGSYKHCRERVCTCRALARFRQSGAA